MLQNENIKKGFIVVAACKDDCVIHLSDQIKNYFARMGSKEIYNLSYRGSFAFIGVYGYNDNLIERMSQSK